MPEDYHQRLITMTIKDQGVGKIHRLSRSVHPDMRFVKCILGMGLYWDRLNIIQLQALPGISCCLLIQPPPPDDFLQHTFGFENTENIIPTHLWSLLWSFVWKTHCWFSCLMLGSFHTSHILLKCKWFFSFVSLLHLFVVYICLFVVFFVLFDAFVCWLHF